VIQRRGGNRRYVDLQAITGRAASGDGYVNTWATYARVPAEVAPAPASNTERQAASTQDMPITHRVVLDFRTDVRPQHRVRLKDTRTLYIRGMQNDGERDRTLVLDCEERAS